MLSIVILIIVINKIPLKKGHMIWDLVYVQKNTKYLPQTSGPTQAQLVIRNILKLDIK